MTAQLLRTTLSALVLLICTVPASSQNSLPTGPTNAGTDFWVSFPANWEYAAGTKYVRLYITSGVRTRVDVWTGENLLRTIYTVPYDIVTVDVPQLEAQVFVRDDASLLPPDQIYSQKAMHIEAEAPIVVYGINRTTATSDGMLLLPVNALGREYIVASARDISDGTLQRLPSQYMIIAPYDNTQITIINSHRTPSYEEGEVVQITMNRGDVYSAMSIGFNGDLSGSSISATKPVAVTAGQNCTYLPDQRYPACDHLCEMMLPISSWGKFYHSVPYARRTKGDMYRIFAGEDDAKLYINGSLYATLPRKGGGEGVGWVQYLPPSRDLIEFSSDKPIMVAQYNNSQTYDKSTETDPFVAVLAPAEQYQNHIIFTTPSDDFPQSYINLVCDSAAFFGIEIAPGATGQWQKLWQLKSADYKKFPSSLNGLTYIGKTFDISPGTYRMRGPRPFGATIYGYGSYDSYGYPLAVTVANLGVDDRSEAVVALTAEGSCNQVVIGRVTDMPEDALLRSNLSSIALDHDLSSNYQLDVDPFMPGIDREATYRLSVIDPSKPAVAVVLAVDMAGNVKRDTIRFDDQPEIRPSESSLDFGDVQFGERDTLMVWLSSRDASLVTVYELKLKGGNLPFAIVRPSTSFVIYPGDSIEVMVEFMPLGGGAFRDTLGIVTDCGTIWMVMLAGTGGDLGVDDHPSTLSSIAIVPTPATDNVMLTFGLLRRSDVQIDMYSIDGRHFRTLMPRTGVEAGDHSVRFDVDDLPPGVYPLRVMVGDVLVEAPSVVVK